MLSNVFFNVIGIIAVCATARAASDVNVSAPFCKPFNALPFAKANASSLVILFPTSPSNALVPSSFTTPFVAVPTPLVSRNCSMYGNDWNVPLTMSCDMLLSLSVSFMNAPCRPIAFRVSDPSFIAALAWLIDFSNPAMPNVASSPANVGKRLLASPHACANVFLSLSAYASRNSFSSFSW